MCFYLFVVKAIECNLVKLETSGTVILPTVVSVLCWVELTNTHDFCKLHN